MWSRLVLAFFPPLFAKKKFVPSVSAIFFLGMHRGNGYAPSARTRRRTASGSGLDPNDRYLRALHFACIELLLLREEWIRLWRTRSFAVRTFQESQGLSPVRDVSWKVGSRLKFFSNLPRGRLSPTMKPEKGPTLDQQPHQYITAKTTRDTISLWVNYKKS